jgi:hypothetical protein
MRYLTDTLPNAKSYATRKNAMAALELARGLIPEGATVLTTQRDDGRWLAVVVYRHTLYYNFLALADRGIVITD